jgi:hypothetical protein
LQQSQAQIRQLEQQFHGCESTTHTGGRPSYRSPERPSHTFEQYTLARAGLCTNHMIILIMKLNYQDKAVRDVIYSSSYHPQYVGELWVHGGVFCHTHMIIQDNLKCHLDLINTLIKNGGRCHQTKSDARLGAAIKNNWQLHPLNMHDTKAQCRLLNNTQNTLTNELSTLLLLTDKA